MDGKKIAIISVSSVVLLTGGYFLYKAIKNILDSRGQNGNDETDNSQNSSSPSSSSSSSSSSKKESSSSSSSKVPFKNTTEGNAFRKWVNEKYPDYAKEISLSLTGSYNNSYITKAWNKYGQEYKNSTSATTSSSSDWSQNDYNAQKELFDRLNDLNVDVNYSTGNRWEWDVTNGYPTVYFQIYKDGLLVLEKQDKVYGNRYAKQSGTWKKTASGWSFTFGGKTYKAPYSGSDLLNTLWGLMKDANYFTSSGKFVPFDGNKSKRNKSQMEILENGCESLM